MKENFNFMDFDLHNSFVSYYYLFLLSFVLFIFKSVRHTRSTGVSVSVLPKKKSVAFTPQTHTENSFALMKYEIVVVLSYITTLYKKVLM